MSQRFDSAVGVLKQWLRVNAGIRIVREPADGVEAAIRVLGAAGQVDKQRALAHLARWKYSGSSLEGEYDDYEDGIRALLEALPDEKRMDEPGKKNGA